MGWPAGWTIPGEWRGVRYDVAIQERPPRASTELAIPISGDALRGEGTASTPSADAEGRVRLRDPGLGIGAAGDPAYTGNATEPGAVLMGSLREHVRPGSNTDYTVVQSLDTKRGGPDDNEAQAGHLTVGPSSVSDDPLLPLGLDSHRYRCCGNGVVAPVSEWLGRQLLEAIAA